MSYGKYLALEIDQINWKSRASALLVLKPEMNNCQMNNFLFCFCFLEPSKVLELNFSLYANVKRKTWSFPDVTQGKRFRTLNLKVLDLQYKVIHFLSGDVSLQ